MAGEVDERCLREVVDAKGSLGAQAADRGDVDDHARLVAQRLLPRRLAPEQRTAQVDLKGLVESTSVNAQRRPVVGVGRRVVDEDVEPAEPLDRCRDTRLCGVDVAGVGSEDCCLATDLGGSDLQLILLARTQHYLGAGVGKRTGNRSADAFGCARDQCDLAVQRNLHDRELTGCRSPAARRRPPAGG